MSLLELASLYIMILIKIRSLTPEFSQILYKLHQHWEELYNLLVCAEGSQKAHDLSLSFEILFFLLSKTASPQGEPLCHRLARAWVSDWP